MKLFWVYMLRCSDGTFYIGVTGKLEHRIAQHSAGEFPSCFTFPRRPVELVYCADSRDANDAIRWEKQIKKWSHAKKAALARGDFEELRRLAKGRQDAPSPESGTQV